MTKPKFYKPNIIPKFARMTISGSHADFTLNGSFRSGLIKHVSFVFNDLFPTKRKLKYNTRVIFIN